jgi:hypothetical protein
MLLKEIISCSLLFLTLSCNNDSNNSKDPSNDLTSLGEIRQSIHFEGRFEKIEKLTQRDYNLFLKDINGNTYLFTTMMPLNETEIANLKKIGNNIKLVYDEFYNPIKKRNEKLVRSMVPQYEFSEK